MQNPIEVFVSYAREDEVLAKSIVNQLENEGLIVWWNKKISPHSSDYTSEINEAIESAQSVLVLWTKNSIDKKAVKWEATLGDKYEKLVQLCEGIKPDEDLGELSFAQCIEVVPGNYVDVIEAVKKMIGIRGRLEHIIKPSMLGESLSFSDPGFRYLVPGMDLFLSFLPSGESGVFLSMRLDTTDGWVDPEQLYKETTAEKSEAEKKKDKEKKEEIKCYIEARKKKLDPKSEPSEEVEYEDGGKKYFKVSNNIGLIKDPIRPYTIQIGKLRSMRPSAEPGVIIGDIEADKLKLVHLHLPWISKTLAEIISNPDTLDKLSRAVEEEFDLSDEEKKEIQNTIARNPNAPPEIQQSRCLFCNKKFKKARCLSDHDEEQAHGAFVVANDFPFGPYFHYLAITSQPVHAWEDLKYIQMKGLNQIVHRFLQDKKNIQGAAGIGFGFNSTVRHLVLGTHTHSSAGASIPHIHKQVWGMAPGTSNLANQLIEVSQAYENQGIDYQGAYMRALEEAGYVIWKDDYVKLYVPYGQSSKYELQVMVCRPCGAFTDLSEDEVMSLSKAEYITLRLFKALGINSFNHVMLSKLFNDKRAPSFRLVELFITREVDLAVSELSSLYVVDQHPWDSRNRIMEEWEKIKGEVLQEIGE